MEYKLDNFSGPLDLLLSLISAHKLDILDIPISILLEQYLSAIEDMKLIDYDEASEFLEMAARLIYIKTLSLLPKSTEAKEEKQKLTRELIDYAECKRLAGILRDVYENDIFTRQPMKLPKNFLHTRIYSMDIFNRIYLKIPERQMKAKHIRPSFEMLNVPVTSVISKGVYILRLLIRDKKTNLEDIYKSMKTKSDRVAAFLAVLELTKIKRIRLDEENEYITLNIKQ